MDDREKSDGLVVPGKLANNAQGGAAESVEGSGPAKGNTASETRPGHGAGQGALSELGRVRRVAATDKEARFTALLHHVDIGRLRLAYFALRPKAAPGVDGVTWAEYGLGLEENLRDLHARVHRGAYRARPSRRVFIPKPDGRLRPLGIAALEDKILQRAVVEVLNAIYETDFLGFSYGFRQGRSPHHALDAFAAGIVGKKVNWVLDGVNGKRDKEAGCRRPVCLMRCCIRDGGASLGGWWSSATALRGEVANHRKLLRSRAVVVSVCGKVAPLSAAGVGQEGERKQTIDDVSKTRAGGRGDPGCRGVGDIEQRQRGDARGRGRDGKGCDRELRTARYRHL
jgi:Reverse transcriptase (RNA-dependent DNA polymerase)